MFSIQTFSKNLDGKLQQDTSYQAVIFALPSLRTLDSLSMLPVQGIEFTPSIRVDFTLLLNSSMKTNNYQKYHYNVNRINLTQQYYKKNSEEMISDIGLNLYPTPASNMLSIQMDNLDEKHYSYKILNSLGELISEDNIEAVGRKINMEVLLDNYATGMYLFAVYSNSRVIAIKTFMVGK